MSTPDNTPRSTNYVAVNVLAYSVGHLTAERQHALAQAVGATSARAVVLYRLGDIQDEFVTALRSKPIVIVRSEGDSFPDGADRVITADDSLSANSLVDAIGQAIAARNEQ